MTNKKMNTHREGESKTCENSSSSSNVSKEN